MVILDRPSPSRWRWAMIALLVSVWLLASVRGGQASPQDRAAFGILYVEEHSWLVELAWLLTWLGDWLVLVPFTLMASAFLFLRQRRAEAVALIVGSGLVRLLVLAQKGLVGRPRPEVEHWMMETSASFPSAHAANAAATYLLLAMLLGGGRTAVVGAVLLTVMVGASRIILGVHWPSDVIGGWAFGAATALAVTSVVLRWRGAGE